MNWISRIFGSRSFCQHWLNIYDPDDPHGDRAVRMRGGMLYYASLLGMCRSAAKLIANGANVNAEGGYYGNALQAASSKGHVEVVKMLLENGANVNAVGGFYGNALDAATTRGHVRIVQLLTQGTGRVVDDDESSIASIESVESLRSHASSASSMSSVGTGDDELLDFYVRELLKDQQIHLLLKEAARRMSNDADKFTRNHARLLRRLHSDLRIEGQSDSATSRLRRKTFRKYLSTRLFHKFLLPRSFADIKQSSVTESMDDKIDRLGHEQLETISNSPDYSSHIVEDHSAEILEATTGSREDDQSSSSSEDEFISEEVAQPRTGMVLFETMAFEQYKKNLSRFVHPSSPYTLQQLILQGNIEPVQEVLANEFEEVARSQFSWLKDLLEYGYDCRRLAELLVDAENETPWIYFEPEDAGPIPLQVNYHLSSCIHRVNVSAIHTTEQAIPNRIGHETQEYLRHRIEELCGLAGIVPTSRDHSCWDGTVHFDEANDLTTATVTYSTGQSPSWNALRTQFCSIISKLSSAFGLLQQHGLCCNAFTVLVLNRRDDLSTRLQRFEAAEVFNLAKVLHHHEYDPKSLAAATRHFLSTMFTQSEVSTMTPLSFETEDEALHYTALTLQMLCSALISYYRAHSGTLNSFFVARPVHKLILGGIGWQKTGISHVTVEQVNLTCLSGLIAGPALALTCCHEPVTGTHRYNVFATPEDIVDTWGRAAILTTPETRRIGRVCAIELGGGILTKSDDTLESVPSLHWSSLQDKESASWVSQHTGGFSLTDLHITGIVRHNLECPQDQHENKWYLKPLLHKRLDILGTSRPSWHAKSRTVAASVGQYAVINVGTTSEKRPGVTVKDQILEGLLSTQPRLCLPDLEALYGVQVSRCTGIAKRVPLRLLLADVVDAFVECGTEKPLNWNYLKDDLSNALQKENYGAWHAALTRDTQSSIDRLLGDLIQHLAKTGIDGQGFFVAAWITPEDHRACIKWTCREQYWCLQALEDSDHCATFACVTNKCFEVDHCRCLEEEPTKCWHDPLLDTEIYRHEESIGQPMSNDREPFALKEKVIYWIGPLHSGLSARYSLRSPAALPVLEVSKTLFGRIPEKHRHYLLMRLRAERAHLRERGRAGSETRLQSVLMCS